MREVVMSIMANREIQFLAVLLAALASVGHARAPAKILNGEDASILDYPYQVLIEWNNSDWNGHCGGTIIDAQYILTAAHCVKLYQFSSFPEDITIITGTADRRDRRPENLFKVQEIIVHPDWNPMEKKGNDIAILKLKDTMSFNFSRKPAKLPIGDLSEGTEVKITGWGVRGPDNVGNMTNYLQELTSIISPPAQCDARKSYFLMTSSKICTFSKEKNGGSPCAGDSGGPLSFYGTVVGVLSQGECESDGAASFTRVYSYLPWIESTIGRPPSFSLGSRFLSFMRNLLDAFYGNPYENNYI